MTRFSSSVHVTAAASLRPYRCRFTRLLPRRLPPVKISTLIVDDEALARGSLSSLLQAEPDFKVVGECADGRAALSAIRREQPQLLFLDVHMPELDGFELLGELRDAPVPAVIFVTAYEQFAVRAFEAQALDYLLKPFRRERFAEAIERARRHLYGRTERPAHTDTPGRNTPDRMVVKSGDRLVFVPLEALEYVRAAANYVRLQVGAATYEIRERMNAMEARLPREQFLRIHRSYIVNRGAVRELYPAGDGEYLVVLRGGRHLPVGPSYTAAVRRALMAPELPRFGGSLSA
jgi:two-component system LytT family response regulator